MAPCGDAVRLVHHDPADSHLSELLHELWPPQTFGRHEHQPVLARKRPAKPIGLLGPFDR